MKTNTFWRGWVAAHWRISTHPRQKLHRSYGVSVSSLETPGPPYQLAQNRLGCLNRYSLADAFGSTAHLHLDQAEIDHPLGDHD